MATGRQICGGKQRTRGIPGVGDLLSEGNTTASTFSEVCDNYWLVGHDKENVVCMVNDITEELLDLDMEPKPESLWWTSTYKDEDVATSKMDSR